MGFGGIPTLMQMVLGTVREEEVLEEEFSFVSTMKTLGDAGGWDLFLMATFGLFVVVGPLVRSTCLVLHVVLGLPVTLSGGRSEKTMQYQRMASTARKGLIS